jgi:ADP-ribose pyrophosphatase YjhB (NUDIX family)
MTERAEAAVPDPAVREPVAAGRTRVGAYALCLDERQRILLCRLSTSEVEPGWWTLPGGGLDFGEDPAIGVLRELEEESGLTGVVEELAGVFSHRYEGSPYADGRDLHFLGILYRVRITGGDLRDEVDGSTDCCAWHAPGELRNLPMVGVARHGIELALPGSLA